MCIPKHSGSPQFTVTSSKPYQNTKHTNDSSITTTLVALNTIHVCGLWPCAALWNSSDTRNVHKTSPPLPPKNQAMLDLGFGWTQFILHDCLFRTISPCPFITSVTLPIEPPCSERSTVRDYIRTAMTLTVWQKRKLRPVHLYDQPMVYCSQTCIAFSCSPHKHMRVAMQAACVCGKTNSMYDGRRYLYTWRQGQSSSPQSVTVHSSSLVIPTNALRVCVLCECTEGAYRYITLCTEGVYRYITLCTDGAYSYITLCTDGAYSYITLCTDGAYSYITLCTDGAYRYITLCTPTCTCRTVSW